MTLELIENSKDVVLNFTDTAGAYFNDCSVNSETDDRLWRELVPSSGNADTVHGELLRGASRIYRDMYQNGGGNLVEFEDDGHSCDHCSYYENLEGEEDYDNDHSDNCADSWVIDDYYQEMFDFLDKHLPYEGREVLKKVKKEVLSRPYDIDIAFDTLVDHVIHLILTTKNIAIETEQV